MRKLLILASCLCCAAAASAQVLTNEGSLTIGSGATLHIEGGVLLKSGSTISNNGTLQVAGDWENNSSASALSGTGTVQFTGTSPQSIGGTQPTQFHHLDLSSAAGPVTLQQEVQVSPLGTLLLGAVNVLLNSNLLQVDNPSATAVTATSGVMVGETGPSPGYGTMGWRIGSGMGTYTFRSGTQAGVAIPLTMQITAPGAGAAGNIRYSTYPTAANNQPLPTGTTLMAGHETNTLDRFWIVETQSYSTHPTATLTFRYLDSEWQGQGIASETDLKIFRWNGSSWTGPYTTIVDEVNNTLTVSGLTNYGIFSASSATVLGCGGLAGTYTINSALATGGMNFNSFADAAAALNTSGLCGAVVLDVTPGSGPYNGQFLLGEITGSSFENTLTVNGNGNQLMFCTNDAANRDIIRFDGTDYVTINGLIITPTCGYGWGVHLMGDVQNVTISGNTINLPANLSTFIGNMQGIIAAGSASNPAAAAGTINGLSITGNTINNGYHGIRINGNSTGNMAMGVVIDGNTVTDASQYGMYLVNAMAPVINDNDVSMRTAGFTRSYGILISQVEGGITVTRNSVINAGETGMWLNQINTAGTTRGLVANNMIGGGFRSTTASALLLNFAHQLDVHYNSTNADAAAGAGAVLAGTDMNVTNNSFAYTGSGNGYAVRAPKAANMLQMNHNNYYSNGSRFVYYADAERASLADMQAAPGPLNHNLNSMDVNPMYVSATNLHLMAASPLIGQGAAIAGVTVDFDNQVRTAPTDIGADEWSSGARTAAAGEHKMLVYPNPFVNELTVELSGAAGQAQLVLTDIAGRQIYSSSFTAAEGNTRATVRVADNLPQGVYLLQLRQHDVVSQHRVVKQ